MDNYEAHRKQIIELLTNTGICGNVVVKLTGEKCCMSESCSDCRKKLTEWFDKEYKGYKIDWSKVPADTPVFVSNFNESCDGEDTFPRHFYEFDIMKDKNYVVYSDGTTSFSKGVVTPISHWKYCRLAKEEDIEKYKVKI